MKRSKTIILAIIFTVLLLVLSLGYRYTVRTDGAIFPRYEQNYQIGVMLPFGWWQPRPPVTNDPPCIAIPDTFHERGFPFVYERGAVRCDYKLEANYFALLFNAISSVVTGVALAFVAVKSFNIRRHKNQ